MATLNSGLAKARPEMTRLIHVLLTPSLVAMASFAPRGFVSKNSFSVMQSSFVVGLSASYTKKIFAQRGCILKLNLVQLRNFNSKANYERYFYSDSSIFTWRRPQRFCRCACCVGLLLGQELTWVTKPNFTSSCWNECRCLRRPFAGQSQALQHF